MDPVELNLKPKFLKTRAAVFVSLLRPHACARTKLRATSPRAPTATTSPALRAPRLHPAAHAPPQPRARLIARRRARPAAPRHARPASTPSPPRRPSPHARCQARPASTRPTARRLARLHQRPPPQPRRTTAPPAPPRATPPLPGRAQPAHRAPARLLARLLAPCRHTASRTDPLHLHRFFLSANLLVQARRSFHAPPTSSVLKRQGKPASLSLLV
jgi:hypothetical protein